MARDGADVAELLAGLDRERAAAIGRRASARVLADHTYAQRAEEVNAILRAELVQRREVAAA